jgi:Fic-DOC domain mobile mystery protein B
VKFTYPPGATPLTDEEALGLRPSGISTHGELNALEAGCIASAQLWAHSHKRKDVLSDRFIKKLHEQMLGEVWTWAGEYRKSGKNIGGDAYLIPVEIKNLCDDTEYWIANQTHPWDELGARFHHRLVKIHPFPNGNGRHGRLMTDVLMWNHDRPLFTWGKSNLVQAGPGRDEYLKAMKAGDDEDFARLFAFVRT